MNVFAAQRILGCPRPLRRWMGWIFYDADCPFCAAAVRRFGGRLRRKGYQLAPLQRRWVRRRLGLVDRELTSRICLLKPDGWMVGGSSEVFLELARQVGWASCLAWLARAPNLMALLRGLFTKATRRQEGGPSPLLPGLLGGIVRRHGPRWCGLQQEWVKPRLRKQHVLTRIFEP